MNTTSRYPISERVIFGAVLVLALAPIWLSGQYFVTGDGPCHSYNAAVLLDWLQGKNTDFYGQFYTINAQFEPNWWTHLWLVALQVFMSPEMAEKIFLSFYVLGFGFGLRFLLRQINPASLFLSSVGLLMCWHHLLQMGFFNYSWSIVGMFWVVGYWLYCRPKPTLRQGIILALGWVALYSMHPMGLAFAGLAIGFSIVAEGIVVSKSEGIKLGFRHFALRIAQCFATTLPAVIFVANYLLRQNWHRGNNEDSFSGILDGLASLSMLITMNMTEHPIKNIGVLLVVLIVSAAIWTRVQNRTWVFADFWLLFFAVTLLLTLTQFGAKSMELLMPLRLQLFPWLGLLFWAASANFNRWIGLFAAIAAFAILLALVSVRLPAHRAASRLIEDWTSVASQISDRSVVMVVNYNFNGSDEQGKAICDRIWMFNHAADYIGAKKSGIIMSDNYEALVGYFPLKWRIEGDMYNRTAIDGIGFEDRPPRVDLLGFPKRSQGRQINYVVTLDQTEADRQHDRGRELMMQLDSAYVRIGNSSSKRAVLFKLRE